MSHQYVDNFGLNFLFSKTRYVKKLRPIQKSLGKNLSEGILKPRKIKLEVFLNSKSKKVSNSKKKIVPCHLNLHFHPLAIFFKISPEPEPAPAPPPPANNKGVGLQVQVQVTFKKKCQGVEVQVQVARCKIIARGWGCRCRFR